MASTIASGTLKVTIKEEIYLKGKNQGAVTELSISDVNEISSRIITVPTSEVEIIAMSTAVSSGTFVEGDVRYIRITNLDDTNHVSLTFKNEDNDEFGVKLDMGQSFIYNGDMSAGVVDTMDAAATAITPGTFADLVNITALADTAACDLEIFVASV
jgi:hypothetical protein|tara:strand:+ start:740 stop:1210 length:471 start_codon:yes stop_codon:yes gene_type:complete